MTSVQTLDEPGKEVDIELLVFIERYANDLLKWDLISLFAHSPDLCGTAEKLLKLVEVRDKDGTLRKIMLQKMEGLSTAEIARQLGVVPRTVQRKIQLIQDLWIQQAKVDEHQ